MGDIHISATWFSLPKFDQHIVNHHPPLSDKRFLSVANLEDWRFIVQEFAPGGDLLQALTNQPEACRIPSTSAPQSFARRISKGFTVIVGIINFLDVCRIWHLGGFGCMKNTSTV